MCVRMQELPRAIFGFDLRDRSLVICPLCWLVRETINCSQYLILMENGRGNSQPMMIANIRECAAVNRFSFAQDSICTYSCTIVSTCVWHLITEQVTGSAGRT